MCLQNGVSAVPKPKVKRRLNASAATASTNNSVSSAAAAKAVNGVVIAADGTEQAVNASFQSQLSGVPSAIMMLCLHGVCCC